MRAYDRGGGGMLAGALAYYAFFTMVPVLLLFVSLLGVIIEDSELRTQLIQDLVDQDLHAFRPQGLLQGLQGAADLVEPPDGREAVGDLGLLHSHRRDDSQRRHPVRGAQALG